MSYSTLAEGFTGFEIKFWDLNDNKKTEIQSKFGIKEYDDVEHE